MVRLILLPVLLWSAAAMAAAGESGRVVFDYQMNCQGCHTPDGSGAGSVPALKGHVGLFLQSQEGREFLVRVPGSATSALSDERLAAVLNWIVYEFAGDSLPTAFTPYTAAEVGPLRKHPLNEVDDYRDHVLRAIAGADARE
jgi:mono/diheme cytochrome c family protein